jgi:type I restriction enzyme S subunit
MAAVDDVSGTIREAQLRPFGEVKKGYTYFEEGDVLFAKITPCMENGKHAIAVGLTDGIGFGTTEFHVFRPSERVLAVWIHQFLRQPEVLQQAAENFTGSVGQQRVPASFLSNLLVPLPPTLDEQRRIAAAIDAQMAQVTRARAALEAQLEAAQQLVEAYLGEMFEEGDDWSLPQLGEIADINPARPRQMKREENAPTTFVPMAAVSDVFGAITNPLMVPYKDVKKGFTYFAEGDVIFAKITPCMQNGKHAIVEQTIDGIGFGSTEFHVIRPSERVLAAWIHHFLRQQSVLSEAKEHFTGSVGQQRVPKEYLASLEIPLPPDVDDQRQRLAKLNQKLSEVRRVVSIWNAQLYDLNRYPSSILSAAFRGEV